MRPATTSRSPRGLAAARPNPRDATLEVAAERLIDARGLMPGTGPLLVGVSGGPDSMALLHFLVAFRARTGSPPDGLAAAHVNHHLRGAESEEDAAFVRAQCEAWGVSCATASVDPETRRRERHESREQAARTLRYEALRGMAARAGADRVAVAHTADDQAETILFRLVRGSGLRGLAGMRPRDRVHGVTVVRPLLATTREQVLDYARRHGLSFRTDSSNATTAPSRNYLRHEILPRLGERLNPSIRDTLLREGALFAEAEAYLAARARRAYPRVLRSSEPGKIALDAAALRAYPKLLQKYLLRCALRELDGEALDQSAAHIEALLLLIGATAGRSADLPDGVHARRERGGVLRLHRRREPQLPDRPSRA